MEKEFIAENNKLVELKTIPECVERVEHDLDQLIENRMHVQKYLDEIDANIAEAKKKGIKTREELVEK